MCRRYRLLFAAALASFLFLITQKTATAQQFLEAPQYAAGSDPNSVAVGDFNGDGKPDLAIPSAISNGNGSVGVFLGNGDGTFQTGVYYGAGLVPYSVATGDFNGDGKLDLVVANEGDNTVSVLLGNGDGTFQAAVTSSAGSSPWSVAAGDFNGDGKLDVAVANNVSSGTVTVLLGNGDGTFQSAVHYSVGLSPVFVATGDFNGDHKVDLVVANSEGSEGCLSVLLGNGDGTFQKAVNYTVGPLTPSSVAVGDFNGDGKPDLVTSNFENGNAGDTTLSVLIGNGDGTFQAPVTYAAELGVDSVTVGDLNGDGKLDIVTTNGGANTVSVLLGNGDGTFQAPVNYVTGVSPVTLALADFNDDHKLDLAAVFNDGRNGSFTAVLGAGDGTFPLPVNYGTGMEPDPIVTGDFNNDGKMDLVTSNFSSNNVTVLFGNGDGTFQAGLSSALPGGPVGAAAGDFNGDGKLDLVAADFVVGIGDAVTVLLGNGNGTFQPPTSYSVRASSPAAVAAADFNGDGKLDLAVVSECVSTVDCSNGVVSVLLGNGDGTFQSAVTYNVGITSKALAVADLNGDGKPDLAVVNTGPFGQIGTVSVLLGNGDGTFQAAVNYDAGANPVSVAAGDLNRDGRIDLAVGNGTNDGSLAVLLGNGNGTFQAAVEYGLGVVGTPYGVIVSDINGDGKLDVATSNQTSDTVTLLLGNGDGTLQTAANYPVGSNPVSLAAADFNGDGAPDLVTANFNAADITVLLNAGGTSVETTSSPNPSSTGQTVTFTTTVSATVKGVTAAPTGTVTYLDGSNTLGSATLSGGVAAFSTSSLGGGTHAITAVYNGDSHFNPHTEAPISQTVQGPGAVFSPGSLTFATQFVGTGSATQTVTLSNTGTSTLTLTSITASGDFAETNTCGSSVNAGASCAISVTFTPTAVGTRTGAISVADNAFGSPQTAALTGTGTNSAVTLTPTSLTFAPQLIGTTSSPQTVTLTDSGTGTLHFTSITASGDFAETNTCGSSINAGASCSIAVTFTPTTTGTRTGTVSVTDDAQGSPQNVSLSGTGTAPAVQLVPGSLTFAGQNVGSISPPQTVTLTNTGSATLTITAITITGANSSDFAQTNTCGSSVAAGASCAINVTFTPTATGARAASVSLTDNAAGSPQTISLAGTGTAPAVELSPTRLTFPGQDVGTTSAPQSVTLTNAGTGTLNISSIGITGTASGDFGETNTCGSSVGPGANCSIEVTFTPIKSGTRKASVSITDNAGGSPQTVSLTGTGLAPAVTLSPKSLAFGNQMVGTTSGAMQSTLTNSGKAPLTITSIALGGAHPGDYAETNTCPISPATLAAGAKCAISVTFTPTAKGSRGASVLVTDNAAGSPQTVTLSGTGITPVVKLTPSSVSFGNQKVGTTSAVKNITLSNTGNESLTIASITITGANAGDFAQTNTCGSSVSAGAHCTISVTFTPTATGARSADVSATDNAAGSPQTVSLSGTGT